MLNQGIQVNKKVELVLPAMHARQKEFYSRPERFIVGCCGTKWGKAQTIDSIIFTDSGWKCFKDLKVGDCVLGSNRQFTRITEMTEEWESANCAQVLCTSGDVVKVDIGHLWKDWDTGVILTTEAIIETSHKRVRLSKDCYIRDILPLSGKHIVKCITVEADDGMYLTGKNFTPTHNSFGAAIKVIQEAWNHPGWICLWAAPSYQQCQIGIDEIKKYLPKERYYHYKKQPQTIELLKSNGDVYSRIEFKSADDPDHLRGFKVNFAIIDEADRISDESYHSIYTTLAPVRGRAYIISTPKTRGGFFYKEFCKGLVDSPTYDPLYYSMTMPTHENPWIDKDILSQAQKNLAEDVFRTEYLAEFPASDGGTVFKDYNGCIIKEKGFEEPVPGHNYIMGLDLAKHSDFTVITIVDRLTRTVVYWERFNQLDWKLQKYKIVEAARKYNRALVVMDTTGIGDVIIDDLRDTADFPIVGYKISSNTLKRQLIELLKVTLVNKTIYFPEIKQLLFELNMFEYRLMDSGTVTYGACSGVNDDCVISLAMAVYGLDQEPFKYKHYSMRGI